MTIEAYAFLAAFAAQILAMSVLCPSWFIRYTQVRATSIPAERFAQVFPGIDMNRSVMRFATLYRAVNICVAALGLALLVWLFDYVQRPEWDDRASGLITAYFMLQVAPLCLVSLLGAAYNKLLISLSPEAKRTASLQRRGVFDYVSRFTVFVAVLAYALFVALMVYIDRQRLPGFSGIAINVGIVTLLYALQACVVYTRIYGRKNSQLETHADRMRTIGPTVKVGVYTCIATVSYLLLHFTLKLLHLYEWQPFALSVFFVMTTVVCFVGLTAPLPHPGAGPLRSNSTR
jgi:hypothetical protein